MGKRKRKRSIIVEREVDDSWAAPQQPPPLAATLHASERSAKQARKEAREFLKAVPEAAEKKAAKVAVGQLEAQGEAGRLFVDRR